jgi:hypothetical protein
MVARVCHPKLRLGGSQFQASLGKKVCETPSEWKKAGYVCHFSSGGKYKIGASLPRLAWAKSETLSPK